MRILNTHNNIINTNEIHLKAISFGQLTNSNCDSFEKSNNSEKKHKSFIRKFFEKLKSAIGISTKETNNKSFNELSNIPDNNGDKLFTNDSIVNGLDNSDEAISDIAIKLMTSKDEEGRKIFNNLSDTAALFYAQNIYNASNNNSDTLKNFLEINKLKCGESKIFSLNDSFEIAMALKNIDFEEVRKMALENQRLIEKLLKIDLNDNVRMELILRALKMNVVDLNSLSKNEKLEKFFLLEHIKKTEKISNEEKEKLNIDYDLNILKSLIKQTITPTKVSKANIVQMFQGFFANNNPEIENTIKSTDFAIYEKQGLPLTYPRKQFVSDLDCILSKMDNVSKSKLLNKMQISLVNNKEGQLIGYNGMINLNFTPEDELEQKALDLANKFILKNRVNTDNQKLNYILNSLIKGMPEFINVIGKTQHQNQDYSIDIHILEVLKDILNNPEYKTLSNIEKLCIKMTAMMHDISKPQNAKDKNHPMVSALYAKDILSKYNLPYEIKDRIFELIKNHHWFELYNTNQKDSSYIASLFRRKNDSKIARIMTEADLKAVDKQHKFYNEFKSGLEKSKQKPIDDRLDYINQTGQMFLTSRIVNKSLIPTIEYKGETYKVIDFTKLPKDFDLAKYGFSPNTTPENLRLLVHMLNGDYNKNLATVIELQNPRYEAYLSTSYISLKNIKTFFSVFCNIGLSLEAENVNIGNAYPEDQGSGVKKTFDIFFSNVTEDFIYRKFISDFIKQKLNLSNEEYIELYSRIQNLKYLNQLDNINEIRIRNKILNPKDVKNVIFEANEKLITENKSNVFNNEVNLYLPKVNAIIAKVNSIDEVPFEILQTAKEHDLPIYIMGN